MTQACRKINYPLKAFPVYPTKLRKSAKKGFEKLPLWTKQNNYLLLFLLFVSVTARKSRHSKNAGYALTDAFKKANRGSMKFRETVTLNKGEKAKISVGLKRKMFLHN